MAGFAGALDLSVVFVAFPSIEDAFPDASTAQLSWVLTTYGIVIAALLVPGGRLADLYGRRRFFLLGALIFGLGGLLSGAAPNPEVLIATRAFQACGGALDDPGGDGPRPSGVPRGPPGHGHRHVGCRRGCGRRGGTVDRRARWSTWAAGGGRSGSACRWR